MEKNSYELKERESPKSRLEYKCDRLSYPVVSTTLMHPQRSN